MMRAKIGRSLARMNFPSLGNRARNRARCGLEAQTLLRFNPGINLTPRMDWSSGCQSIRILHVRGPTHSIARSRLSQCEDQLAELPQPCQLAADAGGSARQGVANVSSSSALVPHESKETAASSPAVANPLRNPSYPQRTHFGERPQLEETLSSWEQKINNLAGKLTALGNHPGRATYERLFFQMQGARDQMAEAVRRMPLETGALYEEDRERFEAAAAALGRLFQSWDGVKT